jgi:adhesin/invasin
MFTALPARAQNTISLTFDFETNYVLGATASQYSGTGTIQPFGNATVKAVETFSGTSAPITATFTISSGDNFVANSPGPSASDAGCVVAFTISGGTGIFTNATGSFTLKYACLNTGSAMGSFESTGTGSMVIPNSGTLSVTPNSLTFSLLQGSGAVSQPVFLNNQSQQTVTFSAGIAGLPSLSVSPATGNVAPFNIATLTVNAGQAAPGTYAGTLTIGAGNQNFAVPITLTVSSSQESLILSKSGLQFQGQDGSAPPPAQSIVVLNQGTGTLHWTAIASAPDGGWLSVTPASGAAGDSANVTADPTNLQPGDHYGLVQFSATGAASSPQTVVVVFHVVPGNCTAACGAGSLPILVQPTGLIFVAAQGSPDLSSQTVTVTNSSNAPVNVTAAATSVQSGLFVVSPASAAVSSASSGQFMIGGSVSGLTPGVYTGALELQIAGLTQEITLLTVVTPPAPSANRYSSIRNAAANCTPTKLVPISTGLSQNFKVAAAWPTPLLVTVVDDCGSLMDSGEVTASFSTNDPPLQLQGLGSGNWSTTWQPGSTANLSTVVITVTATSAQPALSGVALISGQLQPNTLTPAIFSKGVVSTASYAPNAPLAPGAFASIFGAHLALFSATADSLPFSKQLGDAQVIIAGTTVPVQYTSDKQVNVLIPYGLSPNSTQQVIIQVGPAFSTPETIVIAAAQPAIFTQDQSGKGLGAITVVKPDRTQFSADATHPASSGDALVVYCSGLGAVNSPVETGSASPQSPAAKISSTITATIGGKPAPVTFAGLTPGYAGLYQVNLTVPQGITPGPSVPVVLTMGALTSPPVTVAIK